MKSLEGYFDNLAATTVNKKFNIEQLVGSNIKLATTNENLAAIFKTTSSISKGKPSASRKVYKASGIRPCDTITIKKGIMHSRHATSWSKINTSAPLVGEARCDGVKQ